MNEKRLIVLFYVVLAVAILAAVGWIAGSRIESPAEAAARTAPPTPSPILVPVEERVLSSNVVTRGTARFGLPQPISLAPSALKATTSLITTLPVRSTPIKEGDVLLTASGRPVFVLQGDVPAYRDFVMGTTGKDVQQLEAGLERLGLNPGPVDGVYDEQTGASIAEWYKKAGHEPFGPTAQQLADLRALDLAYGDAAKNKAIAAAALATADMAIQAARGKAEHVAKTASADVATRISERAVIVLDPRQLQTARTAADAQLELARAAVRVAELEGKVTYQTALEAKKVAEFDAKLTAERAERLAADLEAAERKLGVQIPVDEIVFIPALPVRVEQITGVVGTPATGAILSVTDNQLSIDSSLPLDAAPLVKPGMTVAIDEQALGIKAAGVVQTVANTPGTRGVDGYHIYFEIRVTENSVPLEGFSLRLTIPIESTKGAVTAVPVSAVSLAADGSSRVQVDRNGKLEYVVVEPGMVADGYVEVTPVNGELKPGQMVVVGTENNETLAARP
jgi:peptidoglycan hydrolase-like protein with peptidoglycan-binding domain